MELDLLALETALLERLRVALAGQTPPVHVLSQDDVAAAAEEQQLVPAVHVIYQNYRVLESRSDGKAARIEQIWLAVVSTRNTRNLASATSSRRQAGLLGGQVAKALMGWRAPGTATPWRLVDGPGAAFGNGFGYLPIAVAAEMTVTA